MMNSFYSVAGEALTSCTQRKRLVRQIFIFKKMLVVICVVSKDTNINKLSFFKWKIYRSSVMFNQYIGPWFNHIKYLI